jgi:phosphoglycerol transferase MdoB-like AlkP superfamily enzyme/glycerophosphoryl diester phosphodiesterase
LSHLVYSASLALIFIIIRALIIFIGGSFFDASYLFGILLSFIPNFFFIYILSLLIFESPILESKEVKKKKKKTDVPKPHENKLLVFASLFLINLYFLMMLLTFFYESFYYKLPSKEVLFYFDQVKHLESSIGANAPYLALTLLILFFVLTSYFLSEFISKKFSHKPMKRPLVISILAVLTIAVHASSSSFSNKMYAGSRHGLLHIVLDYFDKSKNTKAIAAKVDFSDLRPYQASLGQIPPRGGLKPEAPFCEDRASKTFVKNKRSVIMLVLEGLGTNQLTQKVKGQYLVPHIKKVLDENLTFYRFLASGSKSSQALPALFSGLPPQPHINMLWKVPPPRVRGIPNILNSNGYKTSYFHGSDLSFEHQREFLKRVGFKEIIELDPALKDKVYGWGYDDGTMYKKLQSWIESKGSSPYFTTFFSLSTHDPYLLPQSWKPKFVKANKEFGEGKDWFSIYKGDDEGKILAGWESYAFADSEFKKFFDWYEKNEKEKGTLLLIVGDHTPYYLERGEDEHNRFKVPFSIVGLSQGELNKYQQYTNRRGSQHDIPSTLAALLEYQRHPCDQGLNLLGEDESWPADRIIYSVGGESQERMYFWKNKGEGFFDREKKTLTVTAIEEFGRLLPNEIKPFLLEMKSFIEKMSPLHAYAINNNAYFPKDTLEQVSRPSITETEKPLFISHRGNINGPANSELENSRLALENVISSPFKWVELDIQITSDGVPILNHDPTYNDKGVEYWIFRSSLNHLRSLPKFKDLLTLEEVLKKYDGKINFLIEAKNQKHISATLDLGKKIAYIVKKTIKKSKVIIDSFDTNLIASIKLYCKCETGWDTPFQQPVTEEYLNFANEMKMSWIYIHYKVLTDELMIKAHEKGLKVMVYTANKEDDLSGSTIKPDGIITDTTEMLKIY